MSKVAKFDFSSADAYAWVPVGGPDSGFTTQLDVYFENSIGVDLGNAANPTIFQFGDNALGASIGFLYPDLIGPNLLWTADNNTNFPHPPTPATGRWIPVKSKYDFVSGTDWTSTYTIDGLLQSAITPVSLNNDDVTDPMQALIGAIGTGHAAGYIMYIRNFVVRDHTSSIIYSDDFSSGSFVAGGWTVVGACSVIDDPTPAAPVLVCANYNLVSNKIVLIYDQPLDASSVPATTDFAPIIGGVSTPATAVGVSGYRVTVDL